MATVTSKDGTSIAFNTSGQGAPLILVDGALCYRGFGPMPELAQHLAPHFTVYTYDRRGRGESGDTQPYAVAREVEDLEALINDAGGAAFIAGLSSGAILGLEAAIALGSKVKKLSMYEPPYNSAPAAQQGLRDYTKRLQDALAAGHPGDAVVAFMSLVGTPAEQVEGMRHAPVWPMFEAVGPTLAYDNACLGDGGAVPTARAAKVSIPTLVMAGGAGAPFMHETADALAKAIPNAQRLTLEGQTHQVASDAIAPVLVKFFTS